jgi:hypothetical protein
MNNNVLVVAGMHRSGTSLVSQWLHSCGLHLGEVLLGADIGNVEGHFEDVDFYRFHEDTLEANQLSKYGWVDHPITSLTPYQQEKLKSIIALKNKMNSQWGWKDPRTCLFLSHYKQLLPEAYYLVVIRDYRSTVSSLIIRDFKHHEVKYLSRKWFSRMIWKNFRREKRLRKFYRDLSEFYLRVCVGYNQQILKHIQSLDPGKCAVIDYKGLYENDKAIFSQLKDDWQFDLNYSDFKKIFKENLLNQPVDIDPFVNDKTLLKNALGLDKRLKELCIEKKILQKELQ